MIRILPALFSALLFASLAGISSLLAQTASFAERLADAALARTEHTVTYDPAYFTIPYPGGDVPADKGVCTDVVIRAYRVLEHNPISGNRLSDCA